MEVWTIQSEEAVDELNAKGMLRARRDHQYEGFAEPYAWLQEQMIRRIGPPPHPQSAPLWGWAAPPDADLMAEHWSDGRRHLMLT